MLSIRTTTLLASLSLVVTACGNAPPAPLDVAQQVQTRVGAIDRGAATVRGERLLERRAVARFYRARQSRAAWEGRDAEEIVKAIHDVSHDGLTPSDYHLRAVEALIQARAGGRSAEREGDLDILLTDAVAAMVDHIRYGRVHAVALNPAWNVDPREDAPPLEESLGQVRAAPDLGAAIRAARPQHFIYSGLVRELAKLREITAKGGWGVVPAGSPIRPGARSSRIPAVRTRLAASGEFQGTAGSDPTRYEGRLVDAVKEFQTRHRIEPDGVIGKGTVEAMNVSASARATQVRANLERARWVLGGLTDQFLLVNVPAFKAYLIRGGRNLWEARTQVGDEGMQTPTFRATLRTVVFNPDWTVPRTILTEEVLDGMRNGRNVVAQKRLRVYDSRGRQVNPASVDWGVWPQEFRYTIRQPPGAGNALGRVKFLFPNKYSIYLHDTPNQDLFNANERTFSHGCIRVERALDLAEILLRGQGGWGRQRILSVLATNRTTNVDLERPLPVLIVYWTASVGVSDGVRYSPDVYGQDARLIAALNRPPRRA